METAVSVPERCGCGAPVKANGPAPRRLVTLAGEVALRRRRFRSTGCGAERVPLDEALGLESRTQHSLGVRERALWLVTELSYARTAQTLDELRGIAVSRGELHRWVGEEGARLEAARDAEAEALLGEHPRRRRDGPRRGTVWVSADGAAALARCSLSYSHASTEDWMLPSRCRARRAGPGIPPTCLRPAARSGTGRRRAGP